MKHMFYCYFEIKLLVIIENTFIKLILTTYLVCIQNCNKKFGFIMVRGVSDGFLGCIVHASGPPHVLKLWLG